jgi:hypothetical protein
MTSGKPSLTQSLGLVEVSEPKIGDRVRVTYEGVVTKSPGNQNFSIQLDDGRAVYLWRDRLETLVILAKADHE